MSENRFYYKKSRLQQFKGFCYLVELGNMEKVAEKMGLGKSTISVQIKSLEEYLGFKLFNRNKGNKLIANEKGIKLYEKLIPIVRDTNSILKDFIDEIKKQEEKEIKIAAHHTAISTILPKPLKEFMEEKNNIIIDIANISRDEAFQKLKTNEIDFAVYPIENNSNLPIEIDSQKLFDFNMVLIGSKNHELASIQKNTLLLNEIKKYKFFHIGSYMISDMYKAFINKNQNSSNLLLDKGNWEMAKNIAKANISLSSIGDFYINQIDLEDIFFKYIPDLFEDMHYTIATAKNHAPSHNIQLLIETIQNHY